MRQNEPPQISSFCPRVLSCIGVFDAALSTVNLPK